MTLRLQLVRELEHPVPVCSCAIDRNGRHAYSGAWDRNLVRWDLRDGAKSTVSGFQSWIIALHIPASNQRLLATDHVGQLYCLSIQEGIVRPLWNVEAHQGPARGLAVSGDERLGATGGADGLVHLWDLTKGTVLRSFPRFTNHVESLAFHPNGRLLLATGRDCTIKAWDFETGREAFAYSAEGLKAHSATQDVEYGGGRALAFSPEASILACGGRAGYSRPESILYFDLAMGRQSPQVIGGLPDSIYWKLAFRADGTLLALGASNSSGELGHWKPGQDKPLATHPLPGVGYDFSVTGDGRRMIVAMGKSPQRTYPDRGCLAVYDLLDS